MSQPSQYSKPQDVFKNEKIRADVVIVLDDEGNNMGEYSSAEALSLAQERGLDLVQIRYQRQGERTIATAKIIDYGKYLFDLKKRKKKACFPAQMSKRN